MTKEEIYLRRNKSIFVYKEDKEFKQHYIKYDWLNTNSPTKIGQFFVYEEFTYFKEPLESISYPKLGLYINCLPCDQTIEVEWVDVRRTWEDNVKYDSIIVDKDGLERVYKNSISENQTDIKRSILWYDNVLIYGMWDSMPNWKQLKKAYEKTWWFRKTIQDLRDISINNILK